MFDSIGRSIELAKASLRVLRADKELLLFPFVSFIALVIGIGWSLATFLVVPVLVVERVGPVEAIRRSGSLLRRTWGEQIVGNVGIGLVFGLLTVLVVLIGVALVMVLAQVSTILAIVGVILTVLVAGAVTLVGAAASGIFTASLYRYANKGDAGNLYRTGTLATAFKSKG